jgi:hypothetical protein
MTICDVERGYVLWLMWLCAMVNVAMRDVEYDYAK